MSEMSARKEFTEEDKKRLENFFEAFKENGNRIPHGSAALKEFVEHNVGRKKVNNLFKVLHSLLRLLVNGYMPMY